MQRPADGCCNCRPGQRHPRESSHRADRAPHHRRGGAEGPGHALRGPPGAGPGGCLATCDLARLRGNGLIERIAHSNTYRLTGDGLTFALVYTRVHDQVLYPLTAHSQPIAAPAPVRAAWRTITRHIDSTVAATRLGRAA